jgi:hypothetical protein
VTVAVASIPIGKYASLVVVAATDAAVVVDAIESRYCELVPPGVVDHSAGKQSSGAKKAGLPAVLRKAFSSSPSQAGSESGEARNSASETCETPKSEILTVEWSSVQRRLAGLMSR